MGNPRHVVLEMKTEKSILDALYNYGPQRSDELSKEVGITTSRVNYVLANLLEEGSVAIIKHGKPKRRYWILAQDALQPNEERELA